MTNITLTVAEAFPTDFGCGVARVGPDVLSTLNASPGDIVEIEANRNSVATIWRSDRQDWESNTVRIDEFTQRNAGVDLKDDVTIRPTTVVDAERAVFVQYANIFQINTDAAEFVKQQLLDRPIVRGDVIPTVSKSIDPPRISPAKAASLRAADVSSNEPVRITQETTVELRDNSNHEHSS